MEKVKNFFVNRKLEVALFVALVATSKLSGIGFGLLLGVAIFIWSVVTVVRIPKYGTLLASSLVTVVIAVSVYSYVVTRMPRATKQADITFASVDQWATSLMGDKIQVRAKDIWNIKRDEKGQKMLEYYKFLLSQGKPQEASDTLYKFMKAWRFKQDKQENVVTSSKNNPDNLSTSQIKDSVFTKGVYYIPVSGTTPFMIHVVSNACSKYALSSVDWNYSIIYNDNSAPMRDGPNVIYPNRPNPQFRLASNSDLVKLVVN